MLINTGVIQWKLLSNVPVQMFRPVWLFCFASMQVIGSLATFLIDLYTYILLTSSQLPGVSVLLQLSGFLWNCLSYLPSTWLFWFGVILEGFTEKSIINILKFLRLIFTTVVLKCIFYPWKLIWLLIFTTVIFTKKLNQTKFHTLLKNSFSQMSPTR